MIRHLLGCLILICAVLAQGCSTTVLTAPCDSPKVSNSSVPFVYLVMLPYVYRAPGTPSEDLSASLDALNNVAQLQVVRMGAETKDMHVTLLSDDGKGCDIESVYKTFTEKRFFERELRSTVVLLWGEVFEVGGRVLVQSHIRTLWKNPAENLIELDAAAPSNGAPLRFTGWVPYATVTFPTRSFPIGLQPGGGEQLRSALEPRGEPANTAPKLELPRKFSIEKRNGDWVELRDTAHMSSVWVAITGPGTNAKSLLPELSFAHALSAYANYSRLPRSHIAGNAIHWMDEFRSAYDSGQQNDALRQPLAVADAIEAVLRLDQKTGERERKRANELIDRAVTSLPTNSALLNLAAILKIEQCCTTREAAAEIQRLLETARRLDAGNATIARNLLNWYRLLEEKDPSLWPDTAEETRSRARQLAAALE